MTLVAASSDKAVVGSIWNASEFDALLEQFKSSDRFKGAVATQNLLKQLVALVGGPVSKSGTDGKKRKNVEPEEKVSKVKKSKKGKQDAATVEPEVEVEVEIEEVEVEEEEKRSKKEKKERKKEKKEKKTTS